MFTTINVHGIRPEDVSAAEVFSPDTPTVAIRIGELSAFITDTAVLDALHEATTHAYELLVEGLVAS